LKSRCGVFGDGALHHSGGAPKLLQGRIDVIRVVLVYPLSRADCLALASSTYSRSVRFCATEREVRNCVLAEQVSGLILEVDACCVRDAVSRALMTELLANNWPVTIRTGLSPASIRTLISLSEVTPHVRVSLRGVDHLDVELKRLLDQASEPSAQLLLVQRCACKVPQRIRRIVVAASLMSHRHTSVKALAAACDISVRTLEWQLAAEHAAHARKLLGWLTAVHCAWRIDVLGWSLKRAAIEAGFSTVDNFGGFVARWTGKRPGDFCRDGGFATALSRFSTELNLTPRLSDDIGEPGVGLEAENVRL
jgi:hypothetical protein